MGIGTIVDCIDDSGVVKAKIIKVLGYTGKNEAKIGDRVTVVVKHRNIKVKHLRKARIRSRFRVGSIHRGVVVQTKKNFRKFNGSWISFFRNAIIITSKKGKPLSTKIKGSIPFELAYNYPKMGSICASII